jgi:predicted ester cyclase
LTNRIDLADAYRAYIACLNRQDWPNLGRFVHENAWHNGRQIGLFGYREMLERDFLQIPDLRFDIELLVTDPPHIAARLAFHCTPRATFLGLPVDGRNVSFAENVFYKFRDDRIEEVWSVIDKAAIESQLRSPA